MSARRTVVGVALTPSEAAALRALAAAQERSVSQVVRLLVLAALREAASK